MEEDELINLLNETRGCSDQKSAIVNALLSIFPPENNPDLTDIWNLAVDMAENKQITIYEMNKVWGALTFMNENGKCKLAEPW